MTGPVIKSEPKSSMKNGDSKINKNFNKEMKLKRELGLLEAVAITVGAIIGSGIFISPKGITSQVGSVGLSLVIWVACGVISIFGAFSFAELGTTFPSAGGVYTYTYEAFGPCMAFLSIWSTTILFTPVANAILALVVANYVTQPLFSFGCKVPDMASQLIAAAGICFLTYINCCDIRKTTRLVNIFLLLKISALFIIIAGGFYSFSMGPNENFTDIWRNTKLEAGGLVLAIFSGGYAFAGWQGLTHMMEELKEPEKNLPRAIFISMSSVTVVYLLANVAYFSVLTPEEMLASDAVAVTFAEKLLGKTGLEWIVPIFVSVSTFGVLSIHIMITSRQCLVGAREGQLPTVLSFISVYNQSPKAALIFLGGLSLFYLIVSDVFVLITFSSIANGFFSVVTISALLYLRWKKPDLNRPFKVYLFVPILYGLVSLVITLIPIYTKPLSAAIGAIITLSGLPVYYVVVLNKEKQPQWLNRINHSMTECIQKILISVKED